MSWILAPPQDLDVCNPSPCGPNSQCRDVNKQAVCSCLPRYVGSPPGCRPECTVSAECPQDKACVNQKCIDPCPGACGTNSDCSVINHNPICACLNGFTGDPFRYCFKHTPRMSNIIFHPNLIIINLIQNYTFRFSAHPRQITAVCPFSMWSKRNLSGDCRFTFMFVS